MVWTSPVLPKLKESSDKNPLGRVITPEEESWIGACLGLGATFGPFLWGFLADKIGRKYTMIALSIPFGTAYLVLAFAQTVELYYTGRFLAGISLGGLFMIAPLFCTEVAEDKIRGLLSSAQNISVTFSTVIAYAIGPYVSVLAFSLICFAFPLAFSILCFFFITETPYYLVKKDRYDEAEQALMKYRGLNSHMVQSELNLIKSTVHVSDKVSLREVFSSKGTMKGLIISMALMMFQQCSGINIILVNTQTIFEQTKSGIPPVTSSLLVGVVSLIFAIISVSLVDKFGRKLLFLISGVGMLISESLLGMYFYMMDNGNNVDDIYWLPIFSLLLYIGLYNIGFGPLPWVILAEVLPNNIKNKLSPFVSSFSWLLAFLMTKLYVNITESLHLYGAFWLFSGFNVFCILFCVFFVPETKGKSFQEIQALLNS